ncbi:coiled-coil domain-containing protein 130 homolog [Glandiceps talaboti]
MGERKGTNKYYPPDFDPAKHKSLNGYHGVHPLRERARKLNKGILIIRFELPYNIWCDGCNSHVGMGVRYNAEKKKVGNYYSTPIYRFRMKCHLCDSHFEIETDPKNLDYVIVSGARRKNEKWDPEENEQVAPEDRETTKKLSTDPMFKLEHGVEDKKKSETIIPTLSEIEDLQSDWKDDYMLNKMLRSKFRHEKKELKVAAIEDEELLKKSSLDIQLLPENESDKKLASLMKYRTTKSFDERRDEKRKELLNKPLFESTSSQSLDEKDNKIQNTKKRLGLDKKYGSIATTWDFTPGKKPSTVVSSRSSSTIDLGIIRKKNNSASKQEERANVNIKVQSVTPSMSFERTNADAVIKTGVQCSSGYTKQTLTEQSTSSDGQHSLSGSGQTMKQSLLVSYGSSDDSDSSV